LAGIVRGQQVWVQRSPQIFSGRSLAVVHPGQDIFLCQAFLLGILGQLLGGGNAHLLRDLRGFDIENPSKDGRKAQRIVDLISKV
jgi:hypothetical protein